MTVSLRQRVLLWILAIHVIVVGAEYLVLAEQVKSSNRAAAVEFAGDIVSTIRGQIRGGGELNAARILAWPKWGEPLQDAILLDRHLALAADGSVVPQGIALNPLGSARRAADFDYAAVYAGINLAIRSQRSVDDVVGGRIVPIDTPGGVWGACWYRIEPGRGQTRRVAGLFLGVLAGSTILISLGLFFVLRQQVLDPISRLTHTARRVAAGDLAARVEVPHHEDELAELSRAFNAMVAEVQGFNVTLGREVEIATEKARAAEQAAMAERRLAATGKLAAGIAHEINNPLGGLLNAVERLRREDLPPAKRGQYLELLAGGLERIRDTVGKLLRFTPRPTQQVALQIAVPVLDAISLVRHRARRAGIVVAVSDGRRSWEPDGNAEEFAATLVGLPRVLGDANELGQAMLNLLVNALDALEEVGHRPGRIDVLLRSGYQADLGPALLVDVYDNGPGVPKSDLDKLLDLFYTTKDVGKGTGLGLALVHSVVTHHGGKLEFDSEPGRGFHVRIALPALEPPEAHG